jgi:hypothetical protein
MELAIRKEGISPLAAILYTCWIETPRMGATSRTFNASVFPCTNSTRFMAKHLTFPGIDFRKLAKYCAGAGIRSSCDVEGIRSRPVTVCAESFRACRGSANQISG